MVYSASPISIVMFYITAQILFKISCLQDFIAIFAKGITRERGTTLISKNNGSTIFLMSNPYYMTFLKPSGSKVMLCTKNAWLTNWRIFKPKAIFLPASLKVGGINMFRNKHCGFSGGKRERARERNSQRESERARERVPAQFCSSEPSPQWSWPSHLIAYGTQISTASS